MKISCYGCLVSGADDEGRKADEVACKHVLDVVLIISMEQEWG